jgi:hypothetical protein
MDVWLVVAGVCLLVGLAFLIGSVDTHRKQRHERATWTSASGRVVALHEEPTSDGSVFCPVVEFEYARGGNGRFVGGNGSSPATHEIGQTIPVLYDARTGHAQVDLGDWALAGPQLAFGLLFLGISAV